MRARKTMHSMGRKLMPLFLILCVLPVLSGCMGGRVLTLDARYDTARSPKVPFPAKGLKIALVPFEGAPKADIGQWTGLRGKTDQFMLKQPAEDVVTEVVADYLRRAGFDVTLSEKGDDPDRFIFVPHRHNANLPDFVVSGTVERFTDEAESFVGYTRIDTHIALKVRIGNIKDGSYIMQSVKSVSEPRTVVAHNLSVFEEVFNEALSDGVDLIFQRVRLEDGVLRSVK